MSELPNHSIRVDNVDISSAETQHEFVPNKALLSAFRDGYLCSICAKPEGINVHARLQAERSVTNDHRRFSTDGGF